jgi:hypothetical protein
MKSAASILALALTTTLVACSGMIGDPEQEVAVLELKADSLKALKAPACVAIYGEKGCSPYPNPHDCDSLSISIRRDGRTCAVCIARGKVQRQFCGGMAEGIPIVCHAREDLSCQQCLDLYGNTVHDTCNRGSTLYRGPLLGGWSQNPNMPEGSGTLIEPGQGDTTPGTSPSTPPDTSTTPPTPATPGSGGSDKCDASAARQKFAEELNKILAKEGLGMTYAPLLGKELNLGGFWGFLGYGGYKGDLCAKWLNSNSYMTQCWSNEPGKCFCRCEGWNPSKQTCRCGRITIGALRAACSQIPGECDRTTWVGALAVEYGSASAWLNASSYTGGFFGNIPTQPNDSTTPGDSTTPPGNTTPPNCLGSPLVFDLGGDGVAPTPVEQGVRFNLMGHGQVRTAWVKGDDALLALDRNGNGVIDHGAELFGEAAPNADGLPAEDGFQALAALDRPAGGGNGNGLLEAGDLMFAELRLWTDRNHDGVSQPGELRTLTDAGISSISVTGAESCGTVTDDHGNDLSLRGSFTHADGRGGLVVDVLFRLQ